MEYPKSIEEAANLLDIIVPDWAKSINISILDMRISSLCILGQIYGFWCDGNKLLFNGQGSPTDRIFGQGASKECWINEINNRIVGHDFIWALSQIRLGKKVSGPSCKYLYLKTNNAIYSEAGYLHSEDLGYLLKTNSLGWKIYEDPPMFSQLKPGDKFKIGDKTYTKIKSADKEYSYHYLSETFCHSRTSDDFEVVKA